MATKIRSIAVCAVLLSVVCASSVLAASAKLEGTVLDAAGNPIKGVMVIVQSVDDGRQVRRTTDKQGGFKMSIPSPEGEYLIALGKDGYQTIQEPIAPEAGATMQATWTLVEGSGTQGDDAAAPGSIDAPTRLAKTYEAALESYNEGNFDDAIEKFGEVIEARPEIPEPYLGMALSYSRKEDFPASLEWADRYLELAPDDALGLRARYRAYREMGDRDNELATLEALVAVDKSPEVARFVFNEGVALLQAEDLEGAERRFLQVQEMDPELLAAYNALARVNYDQGEYDESISWSDRLLELDPDNGDIMALKYLVYANRGDDALAAELFETLKVANPGFIGGIFYRQGVDLFNDGETAQARVIFEQVLEAQPDHPGAHYSLALCMMNEGNTSEAKTLLQRFLELAPDDPEAEVARQMLDSI